MKNCGLLTGAASDRCQLIGFIGNATASSIGKIKVYVNDTAGVNGKSRKRYDGLAYGRPVVPVGANGGLPAQAQQLVSDGTWTWFNDPRALFHNGDLYFGYVKRTTTKSALSVHNPGTKKTTPLFEFDIPQLDDHNNPALVVLPDGRLLAMATFHSTAQAFFHRTSLNATPNLSTDWDSEKKQSGLPGKTTYMNPMHLSAEGPQLYSFARSINLNPSLCTSDSLGDTWAAPRQFIASGTGKTRPYAKYVCNRTDRIDVLYTDGHPRDTNNSIYHLFYRSHSSGLPGGGTLFKSDGLTIKKLSAIPMNHDRGERGTMVYEFSKSPATSPDHWIQDGRAWVWDLAYDSKARPVCGFQVQLDNVTGPNWYDDRIYYYYARWTGTQWQKRFIAQAGCGIYKTEDDYAGGMAIDPQNANVVYVSSNAVNPFALDDLNNVPLNPGQRYELYRGVTADGGLTFHWAPLTQDSTQDNLRPYVPRGHSYNTALIWLRGRYSSYTDFSTRVMGLFTNAAALSD